MVHKARSWLAVVLFALSIMGSMLACGQTDQAEFGNYAETTSETALGGLLDALERGK